MLDFRINTFLAVCKYMNFTKAAESLCITQPAVSQHIKFLESFYKVKLFEYEGKKLKLTSNGNMLYQTALTMKHDEKYLKNIMKEELTNIKKIKFGATLTIGEFVIPEKLHNYYKNNHQVQIDMIVSNTENLLAKLERGEIDFAFIEGYFIKNKYDYITYSQEKYICVAGADYKFKNQKSGQKEYKLDDLLSETLIVREKGSGTRDILEKNLEDKNLNTLDFKKIMEIGNINAIKHLVENNDGITFLYEVAVQKELQKGLLKKINVIDLYENHNFYFIWRKNSTFSGIYKRIADDLL